MTKNVHGIDRVVRYIVGIGLVAYAFLGEKPMAYWGFIGIVPILTATFRFCPAYTLFGCKSCNTEPPKQA